MRLFVVCFVVCVGGCTTGISRIHTCYITIPSHGDNRRCIIANTIKLFFNNLKQNATTVI